LRVDLDGLLAQIGVEEREGGGNVFWVRLPRTT
jgi:hypothetical protein